MQQGDSAAVGCFADEACEATPFTAKSATYRWVGDPQVRLPAQGSVARDVQPTGRSALCILERSATILPAAFCGYIDFLDEPI